jgi:hypothetical protein
MVTHNKLLESKLSQCAREESRDEQSCSLENNRQEDELKISGGWKKKEKTITLEDYRERHLEIAEADLETTRSRLQFFQGGRTLGGELERKTGR